MAVVLMFFNLISCKNENDYFSGNERGSFRWVGGTIDSATTTWNISCDSSCQNCTAIGFYQGENDTFNLDKTKYSKVYDYCKSIPYSSGQIDTTSKEPIPTGKVSFSASSGTRFGFDEWKSNGIQRTPNINYISVAIGDSTEFNLNIKIDGAFDTILAILTDSAKNNLSFDKTSNLYQKKLNPGDNIVKIYAKNNASNGSESEIDVVAYTDPSKKDTLAGNVFGNEDRLRVISYNKRLINNVNMYRIGYTDYNPDTSSWNTYFNKYLKQAVVNMNGFNKIRIGFNNIDTNSNSIMDWIHYADYLQAPDGWLAKDEYCGMLFLTGNYNEGCSAGLNQSIFIVKGKIRHHFIMVKDPEKYNNEYRYLYILGGRDLSPGTIMTIGKYDDSTSYEKIEVLSNISDSSNGDKILIGLLSDIDKGLQKTHRASYMETIFSDSIFGGVTANNCSCMNDNSQEKTITHEFCHQDSSGSLFDIDTTKDIDNLMYYAQEDQRNKLRYRALPVIPNSLKITTQQQWNYLHKIR